MHSSPPSSPPTSSHRHTLDMIPWLVNNQLGAADRLVIEKHVRECSECRTELDTQRRLYSAMRTEPRIEYAPGASLNRMWDRINDAEGAAHCELGTTSPSPPSTATRLRARTRVVQWLVAAMLIEAIGLTLLIADRFSAPASAPGSAQYQTVSIADSQLPAGSVRIVFAPGMTIVELDKLLRAAHLQVLSGPSSAGVYTLGYATTSDVSSANNQQSDGVLEEAIVKLRANPLVHFAERIDQPRSQRK